MRNFLLHQLRVWKKWKKTYTLHGVRLDLSNLSNKLVDSIVQGRYEEEERKLCSRFISNEDEVIEFGSSIGYLSIYCVKSIGVNRMLCVEPNPQAIKELESNFAQNGLKPEILQRCLTAQDGEIDFYPNVDLWESTVIKNGRSSLKPIKVRSSKLISVFNAADFVPTAIILDIEGAESEIDFSHLNPRIRKIVLEIHPGLIGLPAAFDVLNNLMNTGFRVNDKIGNCYALTR
jgi:FkbM family methyltransferase